MRNALDRAPAKQRTAVAAMLKTVFAQESKADAEAQWAIVADALCEKQPKLGALMDASCDDVLAYRRCPSDRRCCRTLTVKDSHHESKGLDCLHEQARARPLPYEELVRLQRCADEARVSADLAGQGDGLARAA